MQREQRFLPTDVLALEYREADGDDQPKTLSWYAALFDTLSAPLWGFRERIGRRAFSRALKEDDVRGLINHDPNLILGRTSAKTLKLHADNTGLHANVVLPDTSYARDLIVNIRNGNISGGSFGFEVIKDDWAFEDIDGEETLVRTVKEVRLYDVAPVTFPAYPATEGLASVRALAEEWRSKLTGAPVTDPAPETRAMEVCALMKGLCATCESGECQMKQQMRDMQAQAAPVPVVDYSRYRRRLELHKLRFGG